MIGRRSTRASERKRGRTSSGSAAPNGKRQKLLSEAFIKIELCQDQENVKPNMKLKGQTKEIDQNNKLRQVIKQESAWKIEVAKADLDSYDNETDTGASSQDDDLTLEKRRMLNMEQNAMFLSTLGINKIPTKASGSVRISAPRPLKKKEKKAPLPRRASLRIQRITPDGAELPPLPEPLPLEPEHPRKPPGPSPLREFVWERNIDEHVDYVMNKMKSCSKEKTKNPTLNNKNVNTFVSQLSSMSLRQFVKATPDRIFSLAFHPAESTMLAVAGDKWGHLAFWDVARGEMGMSTFEPHSRPVNHIICPQHDYSKVYTASYDGTLRVTDLNKGTFSQVYATEEDDDIRLTRFDILSPQSLIVSQGDGCVSIVDMRNTSSDAEHTYHVHDRLVKCVNVHPVNKNYFLTATNGGQVCLWDVRKLSKKKCQSVENLPHSKSVDAAHFSPVNGNAILTTCYSNRLHVYDSTNLTDIKQETIITHDNQTGRWLTNFRAEWHPQREDLFVIGSMKRPRQIELYSTAGKIVKLFSDDLSSVCSLNAFHPTLNALVGANSSGRLAAFYS